MSLVEMPARAGLESAVDLYLRVATTYATTRREAGAYGDAIRVLERTRDLIGPHLRPIARAELLEDLGFNYLATQTHVGQSTETTLELLNHAQRHGLTRQAMAAQIDLCTIHMVGGDLPGGIRWGRKALAIAEPVASKSDFHGMLRAVAHVEAIGGNGPEAMSLIERARKLGMQSAPQLRLLQLSQASAHMALGEYESAIACARSARDGFVRLGMTRYLGATHRIEAEALAELGRFAEARVEIATALELTERTASAFILAMTYETSAKITGNPRHDDNAKDIFGSLRAQFNTRMA